MKKPYSLDYTIESEKERLAFIEDVLDQLTRKPTPSDLELFATYILDGKDENGKNAVQRGEITSSSRRHANFRVQDDKNLSLDNILEAGVTPESDLRPYNTKNVYLKKNMTIRRPKGNDPGDSDVPGMVELWECIDRLEHVIAVNDGKIPPDPQTQIFTDNYRYWQFKHMVIDLRRHQYYLKDSAKPTIHFVSLLQPSPQTIDWSGDSGYWCSYDYWYNKTHNTYRPHISKNLDDYKTRKTPDGKTEVYWVVRQHTFNWENPQHIAALINYYSALYMQLWDKPYSWGRTLIFDFDRYFDLVGFSPEREYILTRFIDGASTEEIADELISKFQVDYSANWISTIIHHQIPREIANYVRRQRLLVETPDNLRKKCNRCGRYLPRDPLFFGKCARRIDGFYGSCKECEKADRIKRGVITKYDRRKKDQELYEMPPKQTRN